MSKRRLPPGATDGKRRDRASNKQSSGQSRSEAVEEVDAKAVALATYLITGGDPTLGIEHEEAKALLAYLNQSPVVGEELRAFGRFATSPTIQADLVDEFLSLLRDILSVNLQEDKAGERMLRRRLEEAYSRGLDGETIELINALREMVAHVYEAFTGGPDNKSWRALLDASDALKKSLRSEHSPSQVMYRRWRLVDALEKARDGVFTAREEDHWQFRGPAPILTETQQVLRILVRIDDAFWRQHELVSEVIAGMRSKRKNLQTPEVAAAFLTHKTNAFGDGNRTTRAIRSNFDLACSKFRASIPAQPANALINRKKK